MSIGEQMSAVTMRLALMAGGAVLAGVGLLAASPAPDSQAGPAAGSVPVPLAPTTSNAPTYAPSNPVDCADPNNAVNCQTPPIDSPLVQGTASPGSPFRD